MRRSLFLGAVLLVGISTIYFAFVRWQTNWYLGLVPASLQITEIVVMGGDSDVREGCGAVVFRLPQHVIARINSIGLLALAEAREARDHRNEHFFTFGEWKETPYVITGEGTTLRDRWLLGFECAKLDKKFDGIQYALSRGGSFYATSSESALIVIPELGLAVLSYFG